MNKKLTLTSTPKILVLHLKRFTFSKATKNAKKSHKKVVYQKYITIPYCPKLDQKEVSFQEYTLKGIVVHKGEKLSEGHYIAYVKNREITGDWARISDEVVWPSSTSKAMDQEAYMLFYERLRSTEVSSRDQNNKNGYSANVQRRRRKNI